MVEGVRAAFFDMLSEYYWMDEETKKNAETKTNNMLAFIQYPEAALNDSALDAGVFGVSHSKAARKVCSSISARI